MRKYKEQVVAVDRLKPYYGQEQFDHMTLFNSNITMPLDPEALGPFDNGITSDDEKRDRSPIRRRSPPPDSSDTDSDSSVEGADYGDYYPDGKRTIPPDLLLSGSSDEDEQQSSSAAASSRPPPSSSPSLRSSAGSVFSPAKTPVRPAALSRPRRATQQPARLRGDFVSGADMKQQLRDAVGSSTSSSATSQDSFRP